MDVFIFVSLWVVVGAVSGVAVDRSQALVDWAATGGWPRLTRGALVQSAFLGSIFGPVSFVAAVIIWLAAIFVCFSEITDQPGWWSRPVFKSRRKPR